MILVEKENGKKEVRGKVWRKKPEASTWLIGNMVMKSDAGVWRSKKGGLRKHRQDTKRALQFKVDIKAARDYVDRACKST